METREGQQDVIRERPEDVLWSINITLHINQQMKRKKKCKQSARVAGLPQQLRELRVGGGRDQGVESRTRDCQMGVSEKQEYARNGMVNIETRPGCSGCY